MTWKLKDMNFLLTSLLICVLLTHSFGEEEWNGKWFPHAPNSLPDQELGIDDEEVHRHSMGVPTTICDDAETNIELDWDNNPINYTCFDDRTNYLPNYDASPILECKHIPPGYKSAIHYCMHKPIHYKDSIPTFGPHRPLWAKYGEYKFLPAPRWVHNLEHGALVMLYHPCADRNEVKLLRELVTSCIYRHIITPHTLLTPERPFALVTWGCRMTMSKVDPELVVTYIRVNALKGPEHVSRNGQYSWDLIRDAHVVSDVEDSALCPFVQ